MMQPIGWTFVSVLLAIAFSKNVLCTRIDGDQLPASFNDSESSKVTNLLPVSRDIGAIDYLRIVQSFLNRLFDGGKQVQDASSGQARTFGHKRIQFMLMPMMYKMGVMMTMLTVLTVISLKGLLIGALLLMLKMSSIIAKFSHGWGQHAPSPGWQAQPIHVHVHNSHPIAHQQAYNGWVSGPGLEDDDHYYYKG